MWDGDWWVDGGVSFTASASSPAPARTTADCGRSAGRHARYSRASPPAGPTRRSRWPCSRPSAEDGGVAPAGRQNPQGPAHWSTMAAMEQDDRPQNVYDDPQFFAGYSQLDRFQSRGGGAIEHAGFSELLGDVSGRRALDLGCGAGQLGFYLAEAGAAEVVGIDASERMLEVARARAAHPRVSYRRGAMEGAGLARGALRLGVCSP